MFPETSYSSIEVDVTCQPIALAETESMQSCFQLSQGTKEAVCPSWAALAAIRECRAVGVQCNDPTRDNG